jgi:putative ABC transport system permease protein
LLVNKGRSTLTSLGIVIGIAAVIALVSAGNGARHKLNDRLESVGKNLILIRPGARTQQGMVADFVPLRAEDSKAVRKAAGSSLVGVASSQMTQRLVSTSTGRWPTMIVGSEPELQRVRNWQVVQGRFFNEDEIKALAAVCLIGQTVQRKLFPDRANPIDAWLRVDHLQLRVIGVLGSKGRTPTGADQDDQVIVPITTLQRRLVGEERIGLMAAAAHSENEVERAKETITKTLRQQHHLKAGMPDDFDVSSVREIATLAVVLTATMQGLVAIIASISLLVGGVGIMNIMLVAVTERTREIGIRLAVGATPRNILTQFLIEAVVLALIGGALGSTLGIAAAIILAQFADWPIDVSPATVALGFGVSATVGIFFGYYPAHRASRFDPIEALRYE